MKLIETLISHTINFLLGVNLDSLMLDSHKLMYHVKETAKWLDNKTIAPIYVEIGPINSCNHKCIFCGLDYIRRDGASIDKDVLIKTLKNMADFGVKSIMFSGSGEPLLYEPLGGCIKKAKSFGLDVAITTNGSLFDEKAAKSILRHLSWIKLSIDAGKSRTYAKIHNADIKDFDKILKNLEFAVRYKKKNRLNCTIGTQIVLLNENIAEIKELAIKVKKAGADYLVLKPYSYHPESKNNHSFDLRQYSERLVKLSKSLSDKNFNLIYRCETGKDIGKQEKDYDKCYGLDFFAVIDAYGNVVPCHLFHGSSKLYYGNINESTFSGIWKSKNRKKIVEKLHKAGCANCRKGCRMNFVNKYLFNLKKKQVKHINFI